MDYTKTQSFMNSLGRKSRLRIIGQTLLELLEKEFPDGVKGGVLMDAYKERKLVDHEAIEAFTMVFIESELIKHQYVRKDEDGFLFRTDKAYVLVDGRVYE